MMMMSKGDDTRQRILQEGLRLVSELGLEALTIGELAKATNLSKSGLFRHFQSKENLQVEVLGAAAAHFRSTVVAPTLEQPPGLPRLRELYRRWLTWMRGTEELPKGCTFPGASCTFDDRPGPVRDALRRHLTAQERFVQRVIQEAQERGEIDSEVDPAELAFSLYSTLLAFHTYHRLLRHDRAEELALAALDRVLATAEPAASGRPAAGASTAPTGATP